MPAKKTDAETIDVRATGRSPLPDPIAEPDPAETTDPADATDPVGATGRSPLRADPTPSEPEMIECVTLHGRLTHEGKTYGPGEPVLLPAELARGLIDAGHVAKKE